MYISGSVILNFLLFFFYILVKILIISIYHLYKNHNIIILKNILIKEKGKRKNQRRSVTKLDQKSPGLQVPVQVNHFVYLGLHSSEHKATISSYPREGSIPTHLHFWENQAQTFSLASRETLCPQVTNTRCVLFVACISPRVFPLYLI